MLTLFLFSLLLLFSNSIFLFYLLVDSKCQKAPASLYEKLVAVFTNVTMSDVFSCFEQAMWFICHIDFPVCKFDKIKNMWTEIPICRSSCLSYRKIPSCKPIMLDIHIYFDLKRYCRDIDYLDSMFCFGQEIVTTTDCLTNFPSKCFHLNIVCLKELVGDVVANFFWIMWKFNFKIGERFNINMKILFSSFLSTWQTGYFSGDFIRQHSLLLSYVEYTSVTKTNASNFMTNGIKK